MKIKLIYCILLVILFVNSYGQDCDLIKKTDLYTPNNIEEFLEGIRSVNFTIPNDNISEIEKAVYKYLSNMGFNISLDKKIITSNCEEATVIITYSFNGAIISDIGISFFNPCHLIYTSNGGELNSYYFTSSKKISVSPNAIGNLEINFYNALINAYGYKKKNFNSNYTTKLPKKQTCWTEFSLKKYYTTNKINAIEGIYESIDNSPKYRLGLKKINQVYYLIYISDNDLKYKMNMNWVEGEIKATLEPSSTPNIFRATWATNKISKDDIYYITFEQGNMNVIDPKNKKSVYLKMFPLNNSNPDNNKLPNGIISSGTGFAISSDGYIVTNHHVIDDAKTLKVRGINGNFTKSYSAKVIADDASADLAILKINDASFSSLGVVPYTISSSTSDVGTAVYVLGYPLLASMGDEVKLTNGIISSKSGYEGNISSYQVSVPIQPGNSGGPLFDNKGNIIGIINAKHKQAENASYAIKSSYLMNLIESLNQMPKLQKINTLSSKPFTEQVKIVKKFTYIIEVY